MGTGRGELRSRGVDRADLMLVSREYAPFVGGGIGTYTLRMARAIARSGRRAVVVTIGTGEAPATEDGGGFDVVRLPFVEADGRGGLDWSLPHRAVLDGPGGEGALAAFFAMHRESVFAMRLADYLPRLLDRYAPRAIEGPDTGAPLWFALNQRRLGIGPLASPGAPPVVAHLHSPTAWIEWLQGGPQPGRAAGWLRSMEADQLAWADGLACPSGALASWAGARWPGLAGRIAVTPYPLGEGVDHAAPLPSGEGWLYVGRMERRKGFATLAGALGELRARGSGGVELAVAGRDTHDWVAGGAFGARAIREAGVAVRLLGELGPAELAAERARRPFAVVPGAMDNFPNTCMEAMAAGQVVVAANAGGTAEMIEDGVSGLLFEPGSAASLAGALERAMGMDKPTRLAMARAARLRIGALCEDAAVLERRLAHAGSLTGHTPTSAPGREVRFVCARGMTPEQGGALASCLRANAGLDAIAPWVRTGPGERRVLAFATPGEASPAIDHLGPIAVDARWIGRLEERGLIAPLGEHHAAGDPAAVLRALVSLGAQVAAAPGIIVGGQGEAQARACDDQPIERRAGELERLAHRRQLDLDDARAGLDLERRRHRAALAERDAQASQLAAELADVRSSRAYVLAVGLGRLARKLGLVRSGGGRGGAGPGR